MASPSIFSKNLYSNASATVKFHPRYGQVEGENKDKLITQGDISSVKAREVILLAQREASSGSIISIDGNYVDLSTVPNEDKSTHLLLHIKNAINTFVASNHFKPLSEKKKLKLSNLITGAMLATNIDSLYQYTFMGAQMHVGQYADKVNKDIAGYLKIGNQTNSKGEIMDKKIISINFARPTKHNEACCEITYQITVNLRREDEKVIGILERKGITKIPLSLTNNGTTTFSLKMKLRKGKKSKNQKHLGDKSVRALMAATLPLKLKALTKDPHVMKSSPAEIAKLL